MSTSDVLPPQVVTRVQPAPPPHGDIADYADSFALRLLDDDDHTAEQWARAAMEQAPTWMRCAILVAHRGLLQFRPASRDEPQILRWRVTSATANELRLDTTGPLASATILAQRQADGVLRITTYLRYRHPITPRVWRLLGHVHRSFAPRLVADAARRLGHPTATTRGDPVRGLEGS